MCAVHSLLLLSLLLAKTMMNSASVSQMAVVASPKAVKFSELKMLREQNKDAKFICDASAAHLKKDVRTTLAKMDARQEKEDFFNDADTKISRNQYAATLLRMREQIRNFHSVGVFIEHMLHELRTEDSSDIAMVAAAGTWALNLLAHQEVGGALAAISEALLPAIYCEYNPFELPYASAAIQVQIRDPTLIKHNPYFTHSMYVEQVRVDHKSVADIHSALHRAIKNNEGARDYVIRTIQEKMERNLRYHFNAWRQVTRRHRILDLTTEKRQQRHHKANSELRIRVAFTVWKLMVETSRCTFLTDRLNEVAFQLENAKNQFQLQCFRTDRLIQTTKEAKSELGVALAAVETLKDTIAHLEAELQAREEAYTVRLTSHIKEAFLLVTQYREVLDLLCSIRFPVEPYLLLEEDYASPTVVNLTAEIDVTEEDPMAVLVRWCNFAVQKLLPASYHAFESIGEEFYTGEYYLVVLHYVFPDRTSLQPNKDSNISYRLRRICEMCEECRLSHTLTPMDFMMNREDLLVASLSELYRRWLLNRWNDNTKRATVEVSIALDKAKKQQEEVGEGEKGSLELVDELTFQAFMGNCKEDFEAKQKLLVEQCVEEKVLTDHAQAVSKQEIHLDRERRHGAPIRVLGEDSRRSFWKVNYKMLADIKNQVSIGNDAQLKQVVVGSLQMLLKKRDDILSRIFYFFAGENAKTMSEVAFWRFVECNTFQSETGTLTKEVIAQILDRVVSPQLEAAMKAATHGKTEMDMKTLGIVQREIDIRQIAPQQFVLIIIRLAAEFYRTQVPLTEGVKRFLESLKIPSTETLPPIMQQFYTNDVQYVMAFFADDLMRVFFFYLKQQEQSKVARDRLIAVQSGGRFASLFSVRSYAAMFGDCSYVYTTDIESESEDSDEKSIAAATRLYFITPEQLETELVKLKAARTSVAATEGTLPGANSDITFTIFLESFGIFCHFWCPDPFIPLSRKVAAFIAATIRRLIKLHASSTLVLGTPPNVGLEGGAKVNLVLSSGI